MCNMAGQEGVEVIPGSKTLLARNDILGRNVFAATVEFSVFGRMWKKVHGRLSVMVYLDSNWSVTSCQPIGSPQSEFIYRR